MNLILSGNRGGFSCGNVQMNGGILNGVGGTIEVRLDNAILNLIGSSAVRWVDLL